MAMLPDVLGAFCLRTAEDCLSDFGPQLDAMLQGRCIDWSELPPENDLGCVEYKWRLGREHGPRRVSKLATQMRFRLAEGCGTAYYLLGVRDWGEAEGLTAGEHAEAVRVLMKAASAAGSVLMLEAVSGKRGGRCCSAWRVEERRTAISRVANLLHLCEPADIQASPSSSGGSLWGDSPTEKDGTAQLASWDFERPCQLQKLSIAARSAPAGPALARAQTWF